MTIQTQLQTALKIANGVSQQSTGFEAGARVEESKQPISAHLSRPLESPPGGDHMAALAAREDELRTDVYRRINDLKARADDLHAKAVALNHETNQKASAGTTAVHLLQQAKTEIAALLERETRIRRQDLPALEFELANLYTHPTYWALRVAAEGRVAADLAEKNKRIAANLKDARIDFDSHLASLATDETRRLARDLIDACAAAKVDTVHSVALGQFT